MVRWGQCFFQSHFAVRKHLNRSPGRSMGNYGLFFHVGKWLWKKHWVEWHGDEKIGVSRSRLSAVAWGEGIRGYQGGTSWDVVGWHGAGHLECEKLHVLGWIGWRVMSHEC